MTTHTEERVTFPVTGMHCASCQARVQQALQQAPGVRDANVNLMTEQATVAFDPAAVSPEALVETVRGFAAQERTVLEEVTKARASASSIQLTPEALNDPKALERFQAAQRELSGALSRLLVTVERYPELKSNQNFLALQSQLEGTENRIAVERRRFNESVREYNTRLRVFPASLVANLVGFPPKAFFEAAPDAATPPKVKF